MYVQSQCKKIHMYYVVTFNSRLFLQRNYPTQAIFQKFKSRKTEDIYRITNSFNICIKASTVYSPKKVRKMALNRLGFALRFLEFSSSIFHRLKIMHIAS